MVVKFTLTMHDAVVAGKAIDCIIIEWSTDADDGEILSISDRWLRTDCLLTKTMRGLSQVGEASLTVEPIEEPWTRE